MEGSYQVFEWAVGGKAIRARSYFATDDAPVLVGEGAWFWHPGDGVIRGYQLAEGMGLDLFDYRSRWEGDTLVSDLVAYDAEGVASEYHETWEFAGRDAYEWTLYAKTPDGMQKAMGGTFTRH
jgi:hypothetical protein